MQIEYRWTDGNDKDFQAFYEKTEEYCSRLVGGLKNRKAFVPYNISESITWVLIAYKNGDPIGCAGLKEYSENVVEIKRVWVEPEHRRNGIASEMMTLIEKKALELGYETAVLQTRTIMRDAVELYEQRGYAQIENYPPYDRLEGAICFSKEIGESAT